VQGGVDQPTLADDMVEIAPGAFDGTRTQSISIDFGDGYNYLSILESRSGASVNILTEGGGTVLCSPSLPDYIFPNDNVE
jgi:hypothetical protein